MILFQFILFVLFSICNFHCKVRLFNLLNNNGTAPRESSPVADDDGSGSSDERVELLTDASRATSSRSDGAAQLSLASNGH